jgi:hypothetical protein
VQARDGMRGVGCNVGADAKAESERVLRPDILGSSVRVFYLCTIIKYCNYLRDIKKFERSQVPLV